MEDACQRYASVIKGVATVSLQLVPRRAAFSPERLIAATEEPKAGSKQHPVHGVIVRAGAHVKGGSFDVSGGSIVLGEDSVVEAGALICGPAVIGARCVVRHGAYIRGDVALGAGSVAGGANTSLELERSARAQRQHGHALAQLERGVALHVLDHLCERRRKGLRSRLHCGGRYLTAVVRADQPLALALNPSPSPTQSS